MIWMIWYDVIWYDIVKDIAYNIIWYMIWYDMIWYDMIWYGMVWYGMVWYGMIWYDMIWYDMSVSHIIPFVPTIYSSLFHVLNWFAFISQPCTYHTYLWHSIFPYVIAVFKLKTMLSSYLSRSYFRRNSWPLATKLVLIPNPSVKFLLVRAYLWKVKCSRPSFFILAGKGIIWEWDMIHFFSSRQEGLFSIKQVAFNETPLQWF